MKVLIEAPFSLTEETKAEIKKQVSGLSTYNSKITQADIFFKLDDGKKPDVVLAEVQLHVPGPEIFASDTSEDYYRAFSSAVSKAKQQLQKRKEIRQDHHHR